MFNVRGFRLAILVQVVDTSLQPVREHRAVAHLLERVHQAQGPSYEVVRGLLVDPLHRV